MKWPIASASILLLTLLVLAAGLLKRPTVNPDTLFSNATTGDNLQLGYYDLLGHQREIYDLNFERRDGSLLVTLTSPNDNRFMVKASLENPQSDSDGVVWQYRQILYHDSGNARLIKNILSSTEQNGARFDLLQYGDRQLAIAPSGQILLLDPPAPRR